MEQTKIIEKKENKLKKLWNYFSTYEKVWFFSITILAVVFAFLFPEEDASGVNGNIIMVLYLVDVVSNIEKTLTDDDKKDLTLIEDKISAYCKQKKLSQEQKKIVLLLAHNDDL